MKKWVAPAVCTGLFLLGSTGIAGAEPKLIVGVINSAKVPTRILSPAMAEAQRIFQEAGLDTEWISRLDEPDRQSV